MAEVQGIYKSPNIPWRDHDQTTRDKEECKKQAINLYSLKLMKWDSNHTKTNRNKVGTLDLNRN